MWLWLNKLQLIEISFKVGVENITEPDLEDVRGEYGQKCNCREYHFVLVFTILFKFIDLWISKLLT